MVRRGCRIKPRKKRIGDEILAPLSRTPVAIVPKGEKPWNVKARLRALKKPGWSRLE